MLNLYNVNRLSGEMKCANGWKDVHDFPIVRSLYVLHAALEMQRPILQIIFYSFLKIF
jgi:hypothetical protein